MPLLKTIGELKRYVAIHTLGILPSIALELETWETDAIAPLLGAPLLAWLQAAYDAPGFDPAGLGLAAQLLRQVQAPLARLAVGTGLTTHQVKIDDTGLHIVSNENDKTAFQWQSNQLQALLLARGHNGLDALVQWLEAHHDDSPELQAWAASPAGQRHRRELFTSTADFQECQNISTSRQVFAALGPVRRQLEAFELGPVLGPELLQELREQVLTRSLSSENENLLRTYVYPALAALTVANVAPELGLRVADDGLELARPVDSRAEYSPALDPLLAGKATNARVAGQRYLRQLTGYLDRTASATRFATYFHSSAYTAPNQVVAPLNSPDSKLFRFC